MESSKKIPKGQLAELKTLNGETLFGSGDIVVTGGGGSSPLNLLVCDVLSKPIVTGTTSSVTVATYVIPANTIPSDCFIRVHLKVRKIGGNGTASLDLDWGDISRSIIRSQTLSAITQNNVQWDRNISYLGGTMFARGGSGSFYSDILAGGIPLDYAFDNTLEQTVSLRASVNNASDSLTFGFLVIEILKI
jgi:hypothetical protein